MSAADHGTSAPAAGHTGAGVLVRGLRKSFGGIPALDDVSLDVRRGEIHGLLGENGSGKSTLIKVLAGFHVPDAGELTVDGEPVPLPLAAGQFQQLGFAFVHQDLGLIPSLSVLENLRLPDFATARTLRLSWRTMRRDAAAVLADYGVELDPDARVSDLAPVERSLLAIVRAVDSIAGAGRDRPGSLLVLDEPTVYLPQREVDMLFRLLRQVTAQGIGVLFVSHDLDEVLEICDRVTVLRDGRLIDTVDAKALTKAAMVRLIIGHDSQQRPPRQRSAVLAQQSQPPAAEVTQARGEVLAGASFRVASGEILGVTGLAGSGFTEVPYVLYGAAANRSGTLTLGEHSIDLARLRPNRAVDEGIILVPGNRQVDGLVQSLSLTENVTLPRITDFFKTFVLRHRAERSVARTVLDRFTVRPNRPELPVASLSGGNQQKVLLGKWLQIAPRLLLFDEPTQGVDVGAREEIFQILRGETARGAGIVCASSDHEQLAIICDRVLVFARGEVVGELSGDELTKEEITRQCLMSVPT